MTIQDKILAHYDVCVIGLGPVGTVSAACYAKQGFNVLGIDINPERIQSLAEGKAPFIEPTLKGLLSEVRRTGKFHVSQDSGLAGRADIIMIAVGTPTEKDKPDLSQLDAVCVQIGKALTKRSEGPVIAIRSTVPPGTIRDRLAPIIEKASGLVAEKDFYMASNPEFLREGSAVADFFKTSRIIVGADDMRAAARVENLYRNVHASEHLRVSLESAEFAKYVDNTWHALKVSFANEVGRVCQAFGGKIKETTDIFLSDHRLNISSHYLKPGFAFGGSCLPKDVRGLSWLAHHLGVKVPVVDGILPSNREHITLGLNAVLAQQPERVGILGVAFKEHIDDLRESPALAIAAALAKQSILVAAHDPAFPSGARLALPGSRHQLRMMDVEPLAQWADTLVIMHRLPQYYALSVLHTDKQIVDLTKFPKPESLLEKDPHIGEVRALVAG